MGRKNFETTQKTLGLKRVSKDPKRFPKLLCQFLAYNNPKPLYTDLLITMSHTSEIISGAPLLSFFENFFSLFENSAEFSNGKVGNFFQCNRKFLAEAVQLCQSSNAWMTSVTQFTGLTPISRDVSIATGLSPEQMLSLCPYKGAPLLEFGSLTVSPAVAQKSATGVNLIPAVTNIPLPVSWKVKLQQYAADICSSVERVMLTWRAQQRGAATAAKGSSFGAFTLKESSLIGIKNANHDERKAIESELEKLKESYIQQLHSIISKGYTTTHNRLLKELFETPKKHLNLIKDEFSQTVQTMALGLISVDSWKCYLMHFHCITMLVPSLLEVSLLSIREQETKKVAKQLAVTALKDQLQDDLMDIDISKQTIKELVDVAVKDQLGKTHAAKKLGQPQKGKQTAVKTSGKKSAPKTVPNKQSKAAAGTQPPDSSKGSGGTQTQAKRTTAPPGSAAMRKPPSEKGPGKKRSVLPKRSNKRGASKNRGNKRARSVPASSRELAP